MQLYLVVTAPPPNAGHYHEKEDDLKKKIMRILSAAHHKCPNDWVPVSQRSSSHKEVQLKKERKRQATVQSRRSETTTTTLTTLVTTLSPAVSPVKPAKPKSIVIQDAAEKPDSLLNREFDRVYSFVNSVLIIINVCMYHHGYISIQ